MIHIGDCLEVMKTLDAESIDAIVTDPPYGLSFMGKDWDHGIPGEAFWSEALRVAKPGTHLLAFGGTRTFHRLTMAIEDAGWEIRDCIMWVYGSGFPKSHDVSKAIDREAGAEREVVGAKHVTNCAAAHQDGYKRIGRKNGYDSGKAIPGFVEITAPATEAAQRWQGWGTALKPAWEPIIVARKPLAGTVAQNVQAYGTGAVNVDGCRINPGEHVCGGGGFRGGSLRRNEGWNRPSHANGEPIQPHNAGRWPSNLIHDGSDEVVGLMGEAARFFYCAKASKADRDSGLDGWESVLSRRYGEQGQGPTPQQTPRTSVEQRNHHPTVKPNDLMRYLCRLVTPPGGTVLDPFCGSGSTGKAAVMEGFQFIGIELNPEYAAIAEARIQAERDKTALLESTA